MPATASSTFGDLALEIRNLTVNFGTLAALDGLDLVVRHGSLTALLGPNGAGKTTTLDVCEGLRRATSGSVVVLGQEPWGADAQHRARIGVMLQTSGIPSGLRALEAVQAAAALYAHPAPLGPLVERLGLGELGRRNYRRLSGGEKQRVGLAVAMIGRPDLLILDEPTSGMDPLYRQRTWQLLSELRDQGTTVVMTTHQIDEAESVADDIALIAGGRLVLQGTTDSFTQGARYEVTFEAAPGLPITGILGQGQATIHEASETTAGCYRVSAADEDGVMSAVLQWCHGVGAEPARLRAGRLRLEDVVLGMVDWGASR